MKAFVTGADGLLGSNLARELLARGLAVRAYVQPGRKTPTLDGLEIERVEGDLLDEPGGLARAMDGCGAVFHCAGVTDQWTPADLTWRVNLDGTRKVLDACREAGAGRLIAVGSASSCQFGTRELPGDETGPYPAEYQGLAYMESKHQAAELVREYAANGLDALVVAPTFMLGKYDAGPSSGELLAQFVNNKLPFTSPGGRNFVHVRDAAQAMANALEQGRAGESYILGNENLSYLEFFAMVARAAGIKPPAVVLPPAAIRAAGAAGSLFESLTGRKVKLNRTIARLSLYETFYNPAKARKELGLAQTPVEEAVADELAGLAEYGHIRR